MSRVTVSGKISWGLGFTSLAYLAFLVREILAAASSDRAVGVGALLKMFENPWFWATAALMFAIGFLVRPR